MSERRKDSRRDLAQAKRTLRNARQSMSLPEKVAQVIDLQKAVLPAIRRRRALLSRERVWNIDASPSPSERTNHK
jgi:hypothetical protein